MNRLPFAASALLSALAPLLFDSALKGVALLAAAALCALALARASAAARHLVWLIAVALLLVLPALSAALPQWRVLPPWVASFLPHTSFAALRARERSFALAAVATRTAAPIPLSSHRGESAVEPESQSGREPLTARAMGEAPSLAPGASPRPWKPWLSFAWAAGSIVLVGRLLAAHLLLRRTARGSVVLTPGASPAASAVTDAFAAACERLEIRRRVTLLLEEKRTIPVVWGVFHPRLLLPAEALAWNEEQLRSVLLHELAHLRRRDPLAQWLAQIACALYWFNPLVWVAAWRLHVERERACDDLVLASGVRASAYAAHLLHVATRLSPARWTTACGLAMARKSSLEGRLIAVLSEKLNRRTVTGSLVVAALLLGAAIAIPIAMLRAAEERPEAQKPQTAANSKLPDDALWNTKVPFEKIPVAIANWSAERKGLRIGMRVLAGDGWQIGGKVKVELWVHNAGAKDLPLKADPARPDVGLVVLARDSEGHDHFAENGNMNIIAIPQYCVLPAGQVAMVKEFALSFDAADNQEKSWVEPKFRGLEPGKYKLRCTWNDADPLAATTGEWTGELTAPEVEFTLLAQASPAAKQPVLKAPEERAKLNIAVDGALSLNGASVTLEELKAETAKEPGRTVEIHADKTVPYVKVVEAVGALKAAGAVDFFFRAAQVGDGKFRVANRTGEYDLGNGRKLYLCRPGEAQPWFTVIWPAAGPWPRGRRSFYPNVSAQTRGRWAVVWEPGAEVLWWADDGEIGKIHLTDPAEVIVTREGRKNNFSRDFALSGEVKEQFRLLGFVIGRDQTPGQEILIGGNTGGQSILSAETQEEWSVEGRITDVEGKPLANVPVHVASNQVIATAKTDAEGRYRVNFRLDFETLARWRAITVEPVLEGFTERDMSKAGEFNALLHGGEQPQEIRTNGARDFQPGPIPRFAERDLLPEAPGRADFVLLAAGEISGEIVMASGLPAPPHWVAAATREQNPGRSAAIQLSTPGGRFRLTGIPVNRPVIFTVNPNGNPSETSKSTEEGFKSADRHEIRIILPKGGSGNGDLKIERMDVGVNGHPKGTPPF